MAVGVPDRTGPDAADAQIARLQAQHAVDAAVIADLEAVGVIDRAVIAQLEAEGVIDQGKIANLAVALATCRCIGAAIGVIMATDKVTQERAFDVLREASQRRSCKLRDVAEEVLETGAIASTHPKPAPRAPYRGTP